MERDGTDLAMGDTLTERTFVITQEKMNRYSRFALDGRDTANIHTDQEKARLAGLPGPVAHGRHIASFFSEAMLAEFGEPWLRSGQLDVILTKLVLPGDALTLRSTVVGITQEASGQRVEVEMVLVNQKGETVQSSRASVDRTGRLPEEA
jgi:acyl dehydratase